MKKRNKKYSPRKPKIRMYSWESDRSTEARFVTCQMKHGLGWIDLNGESSFSAVNRPLNWTLIVRVIEWHRDGKVDIYSANAPFKNVTLKTLEQEAKLMRKKALQKCNAENIVDVGWVAITFNDKPGINDRDDTVALGAITEERQMLFNLAWREEVRDIVEQAA